MRFKTNVLCQIIPRVNSIVTLCTFCFCIIILVCICFNILVLVCVIAPVCKGASQSWGYIVHNNQLPAWKCGLSNIYFVLRVHQLIHTSAMTGIESGTIIEVAFSVHQCQYTFQGSICKGAQCLSIWGLVVMSASCKYTYITFINIRIIVFSCIQWMKVWAIEA